MFVTFKLLTVGSRLKPSFHLRSLFSSLSFNSQTHQTLHHLLEKCSSMRELKQIHTQILLHGLIDENLTIGKLISFCAVGNSGDLRYGQLVFDHVREPNKFMYNSLIRGYSNSDDPSKGLLLYRELTGSGLWPNEFTLPFVLKVCAGKLAFWDLVVVHGQSIKIGIGSQVCVQNGLVNTYVVCGLVGYARKVFDEMPDRTLVSWNTMIGGYSRIGCVKEAFLLFREMRELGVKADKFTIVSLLSVCSQVCDLGLGRYMHLYMVVTGIEIDQIVRHALLDLYAKCRNLQSAQTIFDLMSEKNVVSWTTMVKGRFREALDLFHKMHSSSVIPDETTLVCILSACSQIGDLVLGKEIHKYISNSNIALNITIYNSLIDMYAKCGALGIATSLFQKIPEKNLVSWNVIIGALALHGCGVEAVGIFEQMQAGGMCPDEFTLTGLLSACSHSGLVDTGRYFFDRMKSFYRISPQIEHYACMVDLLGRGGLLEEAIKLIRKMPMKPDVVVWGAMLGACRIHGNVEIAKQILKQLLELEPHSSGLYVLLSNIFCEAQRWEDVKNIRKLMKNGAVIKTRAISFIEIDGCVFEFMAEGRKHELSNSIYAVLDQLTDHSKSVGRVHKLPFWDIEEKL
ncbi:hypothetical protein UlMin_039434 [Ulmus minor]